MSNEWPRFKQVTDYIPAGRRLFRSGAPNYAGSGASQKLTPTAVEFLKSKGINGIISFNQYPYKEHEVKLLDEAGIAYLHIPVYDFTAPSLEKLKQANAFFLGESISAVLVHCGYGHGRSGTGVTALQLFSTGGANPPEDDWVKVNHVETDIQLRCLRNLRDELKDKGTEVSQADESPA